MSQWICLHWRVLHRICQQSGLHLQGQVTGCTMSGILGRHQMCHALLGRPGNISIHLPPTNTAILSQASRNQSEQQMIRSSSLRCSEGFKWQLRNHTCYTNKGKAAILTPQAHQGLEVQAFLGQMKVFCSSGVSESNGKPSQQAVTDLLLDGKGLTIL